MADQTKKNEGAAKKRDDFSPDVKTARRILNFLNSAPAPEDIANGPEVDVHLHVEYRKRTFPEMHPVQKQAKKPLCDFKLAERIIDKRARIPVYGFLRLEDVLEIRGVRELLRNLFSRFSRATRGEWVGPYTIPAAGYDRPVHGALLRSRKVLFFGLPTGKDSWLWTPDTVGAGAFELTSNKPGDSLFCAGHSFLSDGRLLVAGGGGDGTGPRHNHAWIFDPESGAETWSQTAGDGTPGNGDMAFYRWYPTLVTMGDEPGRVLVVSGDDTSGTDVRQMEMYMETSDRFELVWGPSGVGDTSAEHAFPQIYPGLNLLPGGEVFYTPTGWHSGGCSGAADFPAAKPSGYYEFQSTAPPVTASWTDVGTMDDAAEQAIDRVKGMGVLLLQPTYPFVQAMVVGGGEDPESTTTFQMINLSTLSPKWGSPVALPDGLSRVNVNVVALPNGTVFITGGRPKIGTPPTGGACWIYNPADMSWREVDEVANSRKYHSVALLLADGRVATAGNECPNDRSIEIFSPPYLFASDGSLAPRPSITSAPSLVHHGHAFQIQTPSPASIDKVVLVRPMAVTHQTDTEQRVIQLPFTTAGSDLLSATAPNGWHPHALAPRGWYLLFLVDDTGVPSVGEFMHLH